VVDAPDLERLSRKFCESLDSNSDCPPHEIKRTSRQPIQNDICTLDTVTMNDPAANTVDILRDFPIAEQLWSDRCPQE
jgi:hypothetical protein